MVAGLGFVIALCLWWIYLDLAETSVVGRGALGLVYLYSHFPLLAGVAALGEGTELAVSEAAHAGLSAATRSALEGGVGAFALSLAGPPPRSRVDLDARLHLRRTDQPRGARAHPGGSRGASHRCGSPQL